MAGIFTLEDHFPLDASVAIVKDCIEATTLAEFATITGVDGLTKTLNPTNPASPYLWHRSSELPFVGLLMALTIGAPLPYLDSLG
jgi:hypothetical protein